MKKREEIEKKTEELAVPFCEEMGIELVDTDFVREGSDYYLRIFIDKPGGVTINDCEALSRVFNEVLDEKEYIDYSYTFEVSSPGLTRQLKKEKDYVRSIGKRVDVKLFKKQNGITGFSGILKNYSDGLFTFILDGSEGEDEKEIITDKTQIADIRLAFCD